MKLHPTSHTSCAPVDGWVAFLSQYKLTVTYVKGENNTVADYLSRAGALSDTVALLCHKRGGASECDNPRVGFYVRQEPVIASLTLER